MLIFLLLTTFSTATSVYSGQQGIPANKTTASVWHPNKCPAECKCSSESSEWFMQGNFRTVDCANLGLIQFPAKDLPLDVQVLLLAGNRLTKIPNNNRQKDDIDGNTIYLHDLIHLDLSNNQIDALEIKNSPFREMYNLKILDLSRNSLTSLPDYAFAGLFNLERLSIINNRIGNEIGEFAFHGLLKLQTLELTGNQIEYIQPDWWANGNLHNLHELRLDGNHLGFLQSDSFDNLPGLRRLDLGRNKMSRLNRNCFRGLQNMQILNLDYNLLTEIPKDPLSKLKRNLQSLNLNHNPVQVLRSNDFADFRHLKDISLNYMPRLQIIEQGTFRHLAQLIIVDMHDNPHLTYIDPHAFHKTNDVTHLFFHNNNLSAIAEEMVHLLPKLDELSFYGNPLACDCNSKWLRLVMDKDKSIGNEKSIKIRDADRMICNSPSQHRFKLFTLLKADQDLEEECAPSIVAMTINTSTTSTRFKNNPIKPTTATTLRASFDCKSIGRPKPKIFWIAPDGSIISNGATNNFEMDANSEEKGQEQEGSSNDNQSNRTKMTLRHNGETLLVENVKEAEGVYTCVSENKMGRTTAMIEYRLFVSKRNEADINSYFSMVVDHHERVELTASHVTETSARISWTGLRGNGFSNQHQQHDYQEINNKENGDDVTTTDHKQQQNDIIVDDHHNDQSSPLNAVWNNNGSNLKLTFKTNDPRAALHLDLTSMPQISKNYVHLTSNARSYQIKRLKPDTVYEVCLALNDEKEVMVKFSCTKFKTKPNAYPTNNIISNIAASRKHHNEGGFHNKHQINKTNMAAMLKLFDAERVGNLAVGLTLAVMVFVLMCLTMVVVALKRRYPSFSTMTSSPMMTPTNFCGYCVGGRPGGYVLTPQDCKSFLFDENILNSNNSVPPSPTHHKTPCNVYVNPQDERNSTIFGAIFDQSEAVSRSSRKGDVMNV